MKQYVIIDLEWNTAFSKKDGAFINEIIEFGAVKLNEKLESIDSFSCFVQPKIEKKLRSRTKTITNITNDDIADAAFFDEVCGSFTEWVGDANDTVIMSWGDMDLRSLISNCKYHFGSPVIPFVLNYVDLQSMFMQYNGINKGNQIGLSNAASLAGIDPDEFTHHRALDDSELAAACFRTVYKENEFEHYINKCNEDFYKRIMFTPYTVTDINDKLVDKTLLCCKCHECGEFANQLSEWKFTNSNFTALFYCKSCGIKYRTSVQFKKNYSQLNIKKSVAVLSSKK